MVEGDSAGGAEETEVESAEGSGEVEVASAEGNGRLEGDGGGVSVFGTSPLYTCRLSNYFRPFEGNDLGRKTGLGSRKHHCLP